MTTNDEIALYEDVAKNHFFFFSQALQAWSEMIALSFDLSEGSTERFNQAKERCELARSRARKEYARLPQQ